MQLSEFALDAMQGARRTSRRLGGSDRKRDTEEFEALAKATSNDTSAAASAGAATAGEVRRPERSADLTVTPPCCAVLSIPPSQRRHASMVMDW